MVIKKQFPRQDPHNVLPIDDLWNLCEELTYRAGRPQSSTPGDFTLFFFVLEWPFHPLE